MPRDTVTLRIRGRRFEGWKSVTVTRSIEALAASFALSFSDRWEENQEPRGIKRDDPCYVEIDGERLITGYVDDVEPNFDGRQHGVDVRGRDVTADLVDCPAGFESMEWADRRLEAIAAQLAAPFGVKVQAIADTGEPFKVFRVQEGETAFATIERMCRHRAVLPVTDPFGTVLFVRAGTQSAGTPLVEGANILTARARYTSRDRFSSYTVKGQQEGGDFLSAEEAAAPVGVAADPNVRRFRPTTILAESQGDTATLQQRAEWEAAVRASRAFRLSIKVAGWRNETKDLWKPNTRVYVSSDLLEVHDEMLIVSATYSLTEGQGTTTSLELTPPAAFDLLPVPEEQEEEAFF